MPNKQDTAKAHGEPPGEEELDGAKKNLGWPLQPRFYIPDDVLNHFREVGKLGKTIESEWQSIFDAYAKEYTEFAAELTRRMKNELVSEWESDLPTFPVDAKGMATRVASGKTINAIAMKIPELIGGSADLTPSNKTWIDGSPSFQAETPNGRNIHYGVREHAMGAIVNGMAAHGGILPYSATFLMFSDYMRPAIRLSALSRHHCIWVFTHDSIGVGEDGPTHQPIEHLAALRAIPNLIVVRPGDANEVVETWRVAISNNKQPILLALTRQNIPIIDRAKYASASGLSKGAYILADLGKEPEIILMASGSELDLIIKAGEKLHEQGVNVRLVSFPSWDLFRVQSQEYRDSVLPPKIKKRLVVEAGVVQGWERWVGDNGKYLCIDRFGVSAPAEVLFEKFGFTVENVVELAKSLLN
jgi:transketolase